MMCVCVFVVALFCVRFSVMCVLCRVYVLCFFVFVFSSSICVALCVDSFTVLCYVLSCL